MGDPNILINQINTIAAQVSNLAYAVRGKTPPPATPFASPISPDQLKLSAQSQPTVAPVQASGGVMGGLKSMWDGLVSFFERLFGAKSASVATVPTGWPAVNNDAREQLFAMFPTGRAFVAIVPVEARREGDTIVASATGFGKATITRKNGDLYYSVNGDAPARVSQVTSNRSANGDTRFDITLDEGRQVSAEILADGRTVRYGSYSVTLS